MTSAEDFFDAVRAVGEQIAADRAAHRQAVRDARNARRRARRRAAGPRPRVKPAAVELVDEPLVDDGCRCHVVRMPPCSWCENGGGADQKDRGGRTDVVR